MAVEGLEPPAGTSFWSDRVQACWAFEDGEPQCISTLLDTGTTAMVVPANLPGAPAGATGELNPGEATLSYFDGSARGEPGWMVTAGRGPTTAILLRAQGSEVLAGTPFWFDNVVGYDLVAGTITISRRE